MPETPVPSRFLFSIHKGMGKNAEIKDSMVDNKEGGDKTSESCSEIRDAAGKIVVPKTEKR